jgi:hypothetical protein
MIDTAIVVMLLAAVALGLALRRIIVGGTIWLAAAIG